MVQRMSELAVRRVCVFGAGTIGSSLAAYLTNLGLSVSLVDQDVMRATEGLDRVRHTLNVPERAHEIRIFGFEDGLIAAADADWVVEALPERLAEKRSLLSQLSTAINPEAFVTTVCGSLPLSEILAGLSEGLILRTVGLQFALPVEHRRFVELRTHAHADETLVGRIQSFVERSLACDVVVTPDGPGGIMNRYGAWNLLFGIHVAERLRLGVEDTDTIAGDFLNRPKTGLFGLADLIGLDDLRDIADNLRQRLGQDPASRFFVVPGSFTNLLARGWSGERTGRGFYRRESRERLVLNLTTMAYLQHQETSLARLLSGHRLPVVERIKEALAARDEVGEFLREYLIPSLRYAEFLRAQLGRDGRDFDLAMKGGFGWQHGPFELMDALGLSPSPYYRDNTYRTASGEYVPIPASAGCERIEECPLLEAGSGFELRDLGDGVTALVLLDETLSPVTIASVTALLKRPSVGRFVLTSSGEHFGRGLHLPRVVEHIEAGTLEGLDEYLTSLQTLGEAIEAHGAIAAVRGDCAGPFYGLALSCVRIVASPEARFGAPEARFGLVPIARTLPLLRLLHGASPKKLAEISALLTEGTMAANPDLARHLGLLRPEDVTEPAEDRLLTTAKSLALSISPLPRGSMHEVTGPLGGMIDRELAERRHRGTLTDHDVAVGQRMRQIVARTTSYEESLERERTEFLELCGKALTQARLRHTVETGRPLRN